jgi:hypothetical protein
MYRVGNGNSYRRRSAIVNLSLSLSLCSHMAPRLDQLVFGYCSRLRSPFKRLLPSFTGRALF